MQIAAGEGILFTDCKGKKKPEIQKLYEELEECGNRLIGYKDCFEIMGKVTQQLFQNRSGSDLYENERGSYAQRPAKTGL